MTSAVRNPTGSWLAVASGPGNATVQFYDQPGEWYIHTASSGAPDIGGNRAERGKPTSLSLMTGEYLHIRGRGAALVTADTVI